MRIPNEIRIDATACVLMLHWPDGDTQRIAHAQLRAACPCAGCRRAQLERGPASVAIYRDVALTGMEPMGYGVQLIFSDGHARGIYPWSLLHALARDEPEDGPNSKHAGLLFEPSQSRRSCANGVR
jgi:DUF971 family protein